MKDIEHIIIHCSASPDTRISVDAEEIHRWHLGNHWDGIGYHYVIKRNGEIEAGRPEYWNGSHAKGYNHNSLGVCLVGEKEFSDEQYTSLSILIRELKGRHILAEVIGHKDVNIHKTCPNFDVKSWLKECGL